jgi:hypothetical protein
VNMVGAGFGWLAGWLAGYCGVMHGHRGTYNWFGSLSVKEFASLRWDWLPTISSSGTEWSLKGAMLQAPLLLSKDIRWQEGVRRDMSVLVVSWFFLSFFLSPAFEGDAEDKMIAFFEWD